MCIRDSNNYYVSGDDPQLLSRFLREIIRYYHCDYTIRSVTLLRHAEVFRTEGEELQHPQDTPHARIYDRLTSMCAPVRFTGSNFRKETAQEKLERFKQLMKQRKESL